MKTSILIGGPAGVGINVLARIISAALVREGFFVFNYRDYGSLIRGGNSFNLITFSNEEAYSQEEKIDFLQAFDKLTYEIHKNKLKENGTIATNNKDLSELISSEKNFFFLDTSKHKQGNMAFAGFLFKAIGLSKEAIIEEMKIAFQGKNNADNELIVSFFYEQDYNFASEMTELTAKCRKHNENKEQTLKWIDKYYSALKQCPEVKKLVVPSVVIPQDKYGAYKDKVYLPLNLRVYPTVPQYHRDEAALDLLAYMIGTGKNSLLYKNFI
ncbi:2-oxoacid:acceptor oxidoreductase family protein, partial [Candidatus Woesearchaeota archaeon]|nr:2-oxoacid:acceptor oxidoreductase family protein [Candidatus Woesearchaeota archaeon]